MTGSGRLRVLMLSWEYPPLVVGGLGRHVHSLSVALAAEGHAVTVVTRHAPGTPTEEWSEGVRIVRAIEDPPLFPLATPTLLAWTMAFNHSLTRAGLHAAAAGDYDLQDPSSQVEEHFYVCGTLTPPALLNGPG